MIKLSVLIPSIPSRFDRLIKQFKLLETLAGVGPVEILAFTDNKKRSIGLKRDALVQLARGEYLAFVDDDDEVYENYIDAMLQGCQSGADVIAIRQHATINGANKFEVDFSRVFPNEEAHQNAEGVWQNVRRQPFHTCAWKALIAKQHHFPDASYGEDWHWCKRVLGDTKNEHTINIPLLCYHWDEKVTEAEPVFPED